MGIRTFKPTSPARRYYSVSDFKQVTAAEPERSLTEHQTSTGGRNNLGRITSRFRGGGHKQRYRVIDVNTLVMRGKDKRMGRGYSKLRNWKKAIVTLKAGDAIQFFDEKAE